MNEQGVTLESVPKEGDVEEIAAAVEARAERDPARVLVDVDRTLTTGDGDPWFVDDGLGPEPNQRAIDLVDELYTSGHTIVVWTARPWSVAAETAGWLTAHGIRYHGLRMEKGSGDVYLDDKAVDARDL